MEDVIKLLRSVNYMINDHHSLYDFIIKELSKYNQTLILKIPQNTFIVASIILYYDEDYPQSGWKGRGLITSDLIIKIKSIEDKYFRVLTYAMEKKEGALAGFVGKKVKCHEHWIPKSEIISYRLLTVDDAPFVLNWFWVCQSLKRMLFEK